MRQAPGEVLICSNFWLLPPPKQLHDAEFGQFDGIEHFLRVKAGNGNRGGHSALFRRLHGGLRRSLNSPRLTLTRNGLAAGKGGSSGARMPRIIGLSVR